MPKKAIIIGATSGIGKSLAELLLLEGYIVGVTGRRAALFNEIQTPDSNRVVYKFLDIQEIVGLELKCDELIHELGG